VAPLVLFADAWTLLADAALAQKQRGRGALYRPRADAPVAEVTGDG
jgi:hypothetical protein